ncbi:MAG TPA: adenylate/guanylate cyclase domain-containing protein, partial [Dehalococcoidia bacterium]|nr:adenylate/guanylate cyclase domain-containing protein [Dehalococcoidia bacterium]
CSVFAGGFDLTAAVQVGGGDVLDEHAVLELLDSLVRKSLVAVDQSSGTTRYTLLETIRQFAEDQLAASGVGDEIRDRHTNYFADAAHAILEVWASPKQRVAHAWLDAELANLRAAFRWAMERDKLDTAATLVVSAAVIGFFAQRFEPVAWAEEILLDSRCDDLRHTRGLYAAASICHRLGRPEDGVRYGEIGLALLGQAGHDAVPYGVDYAFLSGAHIFAGQMDRALEACAAGSNSEADPMGTLRTGIAWALAAMSRFEEAMVMADGVVASAEATGVPSSIAFALDAYGKAFAESDPVRALAAKRRAWSVAHDHGVRLFEAFIARDLAGLEASHGDRQTGLQLFDDSIDSFQQSGEVGPLAGTLATLAVFLDRVDRPRAAATLYGAISHDTFAMAAFPGLPVAAEHLREVLGTAAFDALTREGASLDRSQAVAYAHAEIQRVRDEIGDSP